MVWRLGPGLGRTLLALVVVLVSTQRMVVVARAVIPGKNGLLLLAAPQGTKLAGGDAEPAARVADCYQGLPNELWTVRPGGRGLAGIGPGDSGQFSPSGRTLVTSYSPGCYSGNALSVSRTPFHRERQIPGADFTGSSSDATLGPWLGPDDPTFLDPNGIYRDGITGRPLFGAVTSAGPMSCSGQVAAPDGAIGTPVGTGGRTTLSWRAISGAGWLGNQNETTVQWSSDGRYVYFTTSSGQSDRLWRVDADGGGRRLVLKAPASADLLSDVSPNGRWILITTLDGLSGERLSVITTDGRRLHEVTPLPDGGNINGSAEWSPAGDLLLVDAGVSYFSSTAPDTSTGRSFVYVVRPSGGPRHYLSLPGLGVWSPDERFIAYAASNATPTSQTGFSSAKIAIYPVTGGPARTVVTASVPVPLPETTGGLAVSDWQAVPGSARPSRCIDARAPR